MTSPRLSGVGGGGVDEVGFLRELLGGGAAFKFCCVLRENVHFDNILQDDIQMQLPVEL